MSTKSNRVRSGYVAPNGIAVSTKGLVELEVTKRLVLARDLRGSVELRFREDFVPVRMNFASDGILVEDVQDNNGSRSPQLVPRGRCLTS